MSTVEERLARVEDTLAVQEVLARCCHAIDAEDAAAWVDCYSEDARWTSVGTAGGPTFVLEGRSAFAEWFAEFREKVPLDTQTHLGLNARIAIDGDSADVTSTFVTVRLVDGEPVVFSNGLYHDRLVRCADGAWRIADRTSQASFRRS